MDQAKVGRMLANPNQLAGGGVGTRKEKAEKNIRKRRGPHLTKKGLGCYLPVRVIQMHSHGKRESEEG